MGNKGRKQGKKWRREKERKERKEKKGKEEKVEKERRKEGRWMGKKPTESDTDIPLWLKKKIKDAMKVPKT